LEYAVSMLKTFFGFLLAVAVFFSTLGIVLIRLQNPDFLVKQAREINLYGRLADNLEPLLAHGSAEELSLTPQELNDALKTAIDGEQFYDFISLYLRAVIPWLTGDTNELQFSYSLAESKSRFRDQLSAKLTNKYENLPECQSNQLKNWGFDSGLPECRLSGGSAEVEIQIDSLVGARVDELPDDILLNEPSSNLLQMRANVIRAGQAVKAVHLATVVLIGLMLLIWRARALTTIGGAFLFVGLVQLGFSLVAWDWVGRNVADLLSGGGESAQLAPIGLDLATTILEVLKTALGNLTILTLSSGVLMIILGLIYGRKPVSKEKSA